MVSDISPINYYRLILITSAKSLISKLIPESFRDKLGVPSQQKSLKKLKTLGYKPKLILDIGAYEGQWAVGFAEVFPDAAIMMVEGQRSKEEHLKKISEKLANSCYRIELLGAEEKEIEFNIYETASSVLKEDNETGATIEARTLRCLDTILANTPFDHPDFIKLDTQGYEIEILKGGSKALSNAEFVLMEVSFLNIYKECPLASDAIAFMKSRGFEIYDLCSLMYRPYDKALNQADILFVKQDHKIRASGRWS